MRKRAKYHSVTVKQKAVDRVAAGERITDVANSLGIAKSLIYLWQRNMQKYGSPEKRRGKAGPEATVHEEKDVDRAIRNVRNYLRHAQAWTKKQMIEGRLDERDYAHNLGQLALQELEEIT